MAKKLETLTKDGEMGACLILEASTKECEEAIQ